jgi:hypothetical protein
MSDLSPETRRLLNMARDADALPANRRALMKAKLFARVAAVPVFTTTAAAAGTTGATFSIFGAVVKGLAGVVLVCSVGAGSYLAVHDTRPAPRAPTSTPPVAVAMAPEMPVQGPALQQTTVATPARAPLPAGGEVRAKRAPQTNALAAAPRAQAPVVVRGTPRVSQNTPAAEAIANDPGLVGVEPLAVPAPTVESVAVNVPSTLTEETRLLREADRALRSGNSERALTLLDEHATRFPDGVLEPERSAERIIAACKTGRSDAAAAKQYLGQHPGSPFTARIQLACGSSPKAR